MIGPDHLAAVIPGSIQKKGFRGAIVGALWGFGHSLSSSLLGSLVYFLKGEINNRFHLFQKLSIIAEVAVGLTLISIGIVGIKESREISKEDQGQESFASSFGVFMNGFLHGFSWDGIPSLAPTLTFQSYQSVLSFLGAYSIGTMVTMSMCGALVSMISGNLLNRGTPGDKQQISMKTLSFFSSILAVIIGVYWIIQGLL